MGSPVPPEMRKRNIVNCPNLYRIYARDNNYTLTDIIVENCTRSDLNIDLNYDYALSNIQLGDR